WASRSRRRVWCSRGSFAVWMPRVDGFRHRMSDSRQRPVGSQVQVTFYPSAATTYTVYLGEFAQPPASLRNIPGTINRFLPSTLVIAAGDKVTFESNSFHTVTYSARPIPLLAPDPKK